MGDDYTGAVTVAADDGTERELANYEIWSQSETIMEMVKDTDPGDTIPLASVGKDALDKTVEYMEQMAKFKADGTSEEDKQAWIDTYKKALEPQDQLPLLFQTMTAANFMNVKTLLDELCKFVAEMVAQRTPNEILDYFNIVKKPTEVEMLDLIVTYKWIDPEGLLIKELMKALLEKALLGKPELIEELLKLLERKPELNALLESKPELNALLETMKQILAQMQETSGPVKDPE